MTCKQCDDTGIIMVNPRDGRGPDGKPGQWPMCCPSCLKRGTHTPLTPRPRVSRPRVSAPSEVIDITAAVVESWNK